MNHQNVGRRLRVQPVVSPLDTADILDIHGRRLASQLRTLPAIDNSRTLHRMKVAIEVIALAAWAALSIALTRHPVSYDSDTNFWITFIAGGVLWEATRYLLSRTLPK
jgi:hypothetical protein